MTPVSSTPISANVSMGLTRQDGLHERTKEQAIRTEDSGERCSNSKPYASKLVRNPQLFRAEDGRLFQTIKFIKYVVFNCLTTVNTSGAEKIFTKNENGDWSVWLFERDGRYLEQKIPDSLKDTLYKSIEVAQGILKLPVNRIVIWNDQKLQYMSLTDNAENFKNFTVSESNRAYAETLIYSKCMPHDVPIESLKLCSNRVESEHAKDAIKFFKRKYPEFFEKNKYLVLTFFYLNAFPFKTLNMDDSEKEIVGKLQKIYWHNRKIKQFIEAERKISPNQTFDYHQKFVNGASCIFPSAEEGFKAVMSTEIEALREIFWKNVAHDLKLFFRENWPVLYSSEKKYLKEILNLRMSVPRDYPPALVQKLKAAQWQKKQVYLRDFKESNLFRPDLSASFRLLLSVIDIDEKIFHRLAAYCSKNKGYLEQYTLEDQARLEKGEPAINKEIIRELKDCLAPAEKIQEILSV